MKLPVSEVAEALVPIFNEDLKFCSVGPVFQPIMGYLPNTLALPQSTGGFSLETSHLMVSRWLLWLQASNVHWVIFKGRKEGDSQGVEREISLHMPLLVARGINISQKSHHRLHLIPYWSKLSQVSKPSFREVESSTHVEKDLNIYHVKKQIRFP